MNMDVTFGQRSKTANVLPPVFSMYGPFHDSADPMFPVKFMIYLPDYNSWVIIFYYF